MITDVEKTAINMSSEKLLWNIKLEVYVGKKQIPSSRDVIADNCQE
jgi:hypothetical protein